MYFAFGWVQLQWSQCSFIFPLTVSCRVLPWAIPCNGRVIYRARYMHVSFLFSGLLRNMLLQISDIYTHRYWYCDMPTVSKNTRLYLSQLPSVIFWAHLCMLHGGLIGVTFCPSVCLSVCKRNSDNKIHHPWLFTGSCLRKCTSHVQITRWAHCQRQVAFF